MLPYSLKPEHYQSLGLSSKPSEGDVEYAYIRSLSEIAKAEGSFETKRARIREVYLAYLHIKDIPSGSQQGFDGLHGHENFLAQGLDYGLRAHFRSASLAHAFGTQPGICTILNMLQFCDEIKAEEKKQGSLRHQLLRVFAKVTGRPDGAAKRLRGDRARLRETMQLILHGMKVGGCHDVFEFDVSGPAYNLSAFD